MLTELISGMFLSIFKFSSIFVLFLRFRHWKLLIHHWFMLKLYTITLGHVVRYIVWLKRLFFWSFPFLLFMLRETGRPAYLFLYILGNSTKIGAVKRKSSENNGSLVSKQAKSCSEVTLCLSLYQSFLNPHGAWPVCLVVIKLSLVLSCLLFFASSRSWP